MYISLELPDCPTKAISCPRGLHDAEKTPSNSISYFLLFLVFTSITCRTSPLPAFAATTIFLLSGDHERPGCNHFNSSKLTERFPFTNFFSRFPVIASII